MNLSFTVEWITVAATLVSGSFAYAWGRWHRDDPSPGTIEPDDDDDEESTCSGYKAMYADKQHFQMFNDCYANRSPDCRDGRCRFHCKRDVQMRARRGRHLVHAGTGQGINVMNEDEEST